MKKFILCVLAGAIVAQIWGMISWMALPWHMLDFKQFSDDDRVIEVFQTELQGSGLYTLPNMDMAQYESEAAMAEWNEKVSRGPFAFISVRADGIKPGMGIPMLIGFILNAVITAILFCLLRHCSISSTKGRIAFVATAGTVGALYPHIAHWNWWKFPLGYTMVGIIDLLITWTLVAIAIVLLSNWLEKKA